MKADAFRYDGKRAVVVGGATGMGAATAELVQDLGAEVVVMDYAPRHPRGRQGDQRQPQRQGEHRRRGRRVRRSDRRAVLVRGRRPTARRASRRSTSSATGTSSTGRSRRATSGAGRAIGMISSTAGLGWRTNMDAGEGVPRHPRLRRRGGVDRGAPRARRLHVQQAGHQRVRGGARRSRSCSRASASTRSCPARPTRRSPAPTPTPGSASPPTTAPTPGSRRRTPDEQAGPLAFLCSDAARYVSGEVMIVDAGYTSSGMTGTYESAVGAVGFMEGTVLS